MNSVLGEERLKGDLKIARATLLQNTFNESRLNSPKNILNQEEKLSTRSSTRRGTTTSMLLEECLKNIRICRLLTIVRDIQHRVLLLSFARQVCHLLFWHVFLTFFNK